MTLDEGYVNQREALRRDRERDWAQRKADYEEQKLVESIEAEEAKWEGRFRSSAAHWSGTQHWDGT